MSDIETTQSPSSVFYGYFSKYTWRNEKNGNSFFRIVTKQELFFEQQYCKKEVKKNPITEQEETLYTISCDGSKYPVPAYDEKTPIRIRGFFRNLHDKGFGWDFQITDIRESTSDEITTIEYLNSEAFPGVTYQNAVDIVRLFGTDIFAFIKKATAKQELIEKVDLSPETADRIVATVRKTSAERELFAELSEIGISYGACAKAIKWFGNNAISCLRKDPYAYGKKIGLSYKQEELLCKHFSHSANTSCRLRACSEKASDGKLKENDIVLMSSDGLQYAIQPDAMAAIILESKDCMEASKNLIDASKNIIKYPDNMSAMVIYREKEE